MSQRTTSTSGSLAGGVIDVADGDDRSGLDQPTCDRCTDALRAAGDQRPSTGQVDQIGHGSDLGRDELIGHGGQITEPSLRIRSPAMSNRRIGFSLIATQTHPR